MDFALGQEVTNEQPAYAKAASWCNANGAVLVAQEGGIYRIVGTPMVEPSYAELRASEYPDFRDYLDAVVKQASDDPGVVAEGVAQEVKYKADCLAVKAKYPKSE